MAQHPRRPAGLIAALLIGLLVSSAALARADIVFLLRQSERGDAAFFDYAGRYYRQQSGVVLVVDTARSLLQVREFLQRSPLRQGQPWGRIILVAHGSRWTGLSVPIFDDEGIAAPGRWRQVLARGEFLPLAVGVIDERTRLIVESCGLGNRPDLLRALARLLGGAQDLQVEAARGLVEFRRLPAADGGGANRRERPYGARVRPRSIALAGLRVDDRGNRHLPIEFTQRVAAFGGCRGLRVDTLLAPRTPMRTTLSDYGLRRRDLHFDLSEDDRGCRLRGRGELIIEASAADWPIPEITVHTGGP